MQKLKESQSGFTLVELMVAVGCTMFFLTAFMAAFLGMRNGLYSQDSYLKSNRNAYYAMNVISKDVREALQIEDSYGGRTTGTSVLVLRLPSISAGGAPTNISTQFDYASYYLSGTDLMRSLDVLGGTSQRNGGNDISSQRIGTNVSALSFSNSSGTAFSSLSAAQQEALKIFNVAITSSETVANQARTMVTDSDMVLMNK